MNYQKIKMLLFIFLFTTLSVINGQDTIKILAIGNSFSEDAAQEYLDDLAKAGGVNVVVGNLYRGGCDLQTHWNYANTNGAGYEYRKVANGVLTNTTNYTIAKAVADDNWDYITFQQVSQYSGMYNTYFPYLTNLLNYVKGIATNPNVKYCMHRTWAYATNSTHAGFVNYSNNQILMYDSIVSATNKAAAKVGINIIIPAGTAIQNGRSSYIGDNFCRDGYHLSYGLGRYTAACVWYEKLLGKSAIGNTFSPAGVTNAEANVAQNAAHYALLKADSVTSMADSVFGPPIGINKEVFVNFGSKLAPSPWNNHSSVAVGSKIYSLSDTAAANTGVSITVNDAFSNISGTGPLTTNTGFNIPSEVSSESFYGNGVVFENKLEPTGGFLLSGLVANKKYDFDFFSGQSGMADNCETSFTVTGTNTLSGVINASNNTTNVLSLKGISPQTNGTISIVVGVGSNNTNANKSFYVNALLIRPNTMTAVNEITEKDFILYPNPVKSVAHLETIEDLNNVEIYDLSGRKLLVFNNIKTNKTDLDLSSLNAGCYILKTQKKCIHFVKIQ